jgi:predicted LPLAT superfamily acyltransferase
MQNQPKWEGQSVGKVWGYKFFVFILNTFGLRPAYFILRFVSFYYFLFSKPNKFIRDYFVKAHGFSKRRAFWAVYKNNFIFGQTIIDKVAIMAGAKKVIKVVHPGGETLDSLVAMGKGGILVSAHVGNWEVAGQGLNRLNVPFNILMYENERANIKGYMDAVMKQKKIKIIGINEETKSHIIELHRAFSNNELVVMHGDRFREGAKTLTANFFGRPARFPAGPFIMAAKFGVPLGIVFAIKKNNTTYEFTCEEPILVPRARTEEQVEKACREMLAKYISALENKLREVPHQWFNYYDFWTQ